MRDRQQEAKNEEDQRKQKYNDALVDTLSEFIITAVMGIFVGIFFIWYSAKDNSIASFGEGVGLFFTTFCIPFGWKFLTYLQSFFPLSIFGTFWFWFIYGAIKLLLSILVGIPAFIYQLVKTILAQNKMNKLK